VSHIISHTLVLLLLLRRRAAHGVIHLLEYRQRGSNLPTVDEHILQYLSGPKTLYETLLRIAARRSIQLGFPEEVPALPRHLDSSSCSRLGMLSARPCLASRLFSPGCTRTGRRRGGSGHKNLSSANSATS